MSPNTPSFDPQFPYKLSDDDYSRLSQIHGLLTVLTDLTGESKPDRHIDCSVLHHALWGISDSLDTVMLGFEHQSKRMLETAKAAHHSIYQPTTAQA